MQGRVLIIAGSDSGGGAGLQGDIKTVTCLGGYAATAVTAITVQDSTGVHDIQPLSADLVADQMRVVLRDIGADVIKCGMLANAEIINAVADIRDQYAADVPMVVDPVLASTAGQSLLAGDAGDILKSRILSKAAVITPNIPEAEILSNQNIASLEDMISVATKLLHLGAGAVLLTGGHLPGGKLTDVLAVEETIDLFESERIESVHTHGTGCALAAAVATRLAQQMTLKEAVERARHFVRRAIENAPGYGRGHGPMGHQPLKN
ncbi:MAG: bifunctional hydroxymethylpyrimidine kinase/phosphomethylpyrimidine kinase [Kordiimonas sp.]|nr:bifunctional hydroxymethylpyrimidine kinase/phosphomethylpyrimidine kinase [Kordiimonas sp.]|tara:strand:+ start:3514 stop:4305 length:792 start_codon:yes stop_codon:yes gene_type:complete